MWTGDDVDDAIVAAHESGHLNGTVYGSWSSTGVVTTKVVTLLVLPMVVVSSTGVVLVGVMTVSLVVGTVLWRIMMIG